MSKINRRNFLAGAGSLALLGAGGYAMTRNRHGATALAEGLKRLAMPPLLDTTGSGELDLTALAGETNFLGGAATRTIGYNQTYLGPTIRMKNGPLAARIQNALNEPVTVHWHGLMVPGEHDGGPHSAINPGGVKSLDMQIGQGPGTPFYHTHTHGRTAEQVHAGLAGVVQVNDDRDDDRGLPSAYGIDDLTLVLQDRRFDDSGRMVYGLSMMDVMHGFTGDTMLINGQANTVAAVPKSIARLRLVNGSNARIYNLFADDGRPLHLIATDGGYVPEPVSLETLRLGPGERAEVLVDFTPGRPMTLMSEADPNQGPGGMMGHLRGVIDSVLGNSFPVLPFQVDETMPARISKLPGRIGDAMPDISGSEVRTRRFSLDMGMGGMMGGFAINGQPFDMNRIDLEARKDTVERWIVSSPMLAHPFHVHGASFQVVREDGRAPRPESLGWKDTVVVPMGSDVELLVRFAHAADAAHPYMFHCHILEHEDAGMMGQFTVS
ncbi:MAG: multicopper oxidase domain-containing protein [Rhodobiaceae bacterium]|nr:multicopper oxidase domain-containing protein [Rhodobiaceae bacterium]MCC0051894.1 multicopper oxidase domain-containing protein [Rhodobiaceae bacterium]